MVDLKKNNISLHEIASEQIIKNEFGDIEYDFYPNRTFVDSVTIGYWKTEISYIEEVMELFWLFDSLNIQVIVLGSRNQIPMWSLYSHKMIEISNSPGTQNLSNNYFSQKEKYFNAGKVDLCPGLKGKDWFAPGVPIFRNFGKRWVAPGIEHYKDEIKKLTKGGWKDVYDIEENDWFLFQSPKMNEFYMNRDKNIHYTQDAYNGYENVLNEFQFDSSPKVNLEFKWTSLQGGYRLERYQSLLINDVVNKLVEDGLGNQIYNHDFECFKFPCTDNKTTFPFTKSLEKLTNGNLSFTSIMLSLKHKFANVSQAGSSSYFYLMPVNILWAEHQYLYSLYKHGKYFRDRPMQKCFDNKSEIFATLYTGSPGGRPRKDKRTGWDNGFPDEYIEENLHYINNVYTFEYFYELISNYLRK